MIFKDNQLVLRRVAFNSIPLSWLEKTLLTFPFLYKLPLIEYESQLLPEDRNVILHEINDILQHGIDGDIIECGTARCGTTAIISNFLKKKGSEKHLYACDSFGGFIPKELQIEQRLGRTRAPEGAFTKNSYEYVSAKMKALGCNNVTLVKGFFQDTLPDLVENKRFSFAFIDCDLAGSMLFAMEQVWPKLSSGGAMLCDDYKTDKSGGVYHAMSEFLERYKNEIASHGTKTSTGKIYYVNKN
jgi:O-methyltransferase